MNAATEFARIPTDPAMRTDQGSYMLAGTKMRLVAYRLGKSTQAPGAIRLRVENTTSNYENDWHLATLKLCPTSCRALAAKLLDLAELADLEAFVHKTSTSTSTGSAAAANTPGAAA